MLGDTKTESVAEAMAQYLRLTSETRAAYKGAQYVVAIALVREGQRMTPRRTRKQVSELLGISESEVTKMAQREAIAMVERGCSPAQIERELGVRPSTVRKIREGG